MRNKHGILVIFWTVLQCCNGAYQSYVTCGSVLKLFNAGHQVRLHSHDIAYSTGSKQQSVTGTNSADDVNSYWMVKSDKEFKCARGVPVLCGSVIRLEHLQTRKNLHSHHFTSPITGSQEISCYGVNGTGDTGDLWKVVCSGSQWNIKDTVMLNHVDTKVYLSASGEKYDRPIKGQMEIVGVVDNKSSGVHWLAKEGAYLHSPDEQQHVHTEL